MKKTKESCSILDCDRPSDSRGWCKMHYQRWRVHGDPTINKAPRHNGAPCSVPGCEKQAQMRGWCRMHHDRYLRNGEVGQAKPLLGARKMTIEEYIEHHSAPPDEKGCRLWLSVLNEGGYPLNCSHRADGWGKFAHRVKYELETGERLASYDSIHHKCGVKSCVEITHLQKVTRRENTAEMLERRYYLGRIAELEAENLRLQDRVVELETRNLQYV